MFRTRLCIPTPVSRLGFIVHVCVGQVWERRWPLLIFGLATASLALVEHVIVVKCQPLAAFNFTGRMVSGKSIDLLLAFPLLHANDTA